MAENPDPQQTLEEFQRIATSLLALLGSDVRLSGDQENALVDTLHDLQLAYNEWVRRTPVKDQSFPPSDRQA